jgi:hypothetical protein
MSNFPNSYPPQTHPALFYVVGVVAVVAAALCGYALGSWPSWP